MDMMPPHACPLQLLDLVAEVQAKAQQVVALLHFNAMLCARERVLRRAVEAGDLKLLQLESGPLLVYSPGAAATGYIGSAGTQPQSVGLSMPSHAAAAGVPAGLYPQPAGFSMPYHATAAASAPAGFPPQLDGFSTFHAAAAAELPAVMSRPQGSCVTHAGAVATCGTMQRKGLIYPAGPGSDRTTASAITPEAVTQPLGLGALAAAHAAALAEGNGGPVAGPQLPNGTSEAGASQPQGLGWELPPATGDAELEWMLGRLRELPPAEKAPLDVLQCISRRVKEVVDTYEVSKGRKPERTWSQGQWVMIDHGCVGMNMS